MRGIESRWSDSQLIGTHVRSVWKWQLVFTFTTVAIAVIVAVLDVSILSRWTFAAGLVLTIAVSSASLVIAWARHPKTAALALPFLDIVAIGLMSSAEERLAFLWVFPIAWLATYSRMAALVAALLLIGLQLLIGTWDEGYSPSVVLQLLITLISLTFLGITILIGARRTRAFGHLMARQSRRLDRALQRAQTHEARTSALFDSIGTALARVNARGEIVAANAAYRDLHSLDEQDYGLPGPAVEYDDYRGTALPAARTTLARAARGERVERDTVWVFDRSGTWHALALSLRASGLDDDGQPTTLIELHDVTALMELQRAQPTSARVISHELRNPLTAILGHTDLLLEGDATPAQRQHLSVIESAGERMLTLIHGLLTPDPESGGATVSFDLGEVVTASVDAFAPAARAADLRLEREIDGPIPLEGDAFRLRQVVDNLLSNAIKYTVRGGTVRVSASVSPDGDATVAVADTGIGMSPDELARVFDPYFRSQSARDGGVPGTGLGMGIARDILADQGGTIAVDSALGKGTTVVVRLPAEHAVIPERGTR